MTKLKNLCCRLCGEEIIFTYERPWQSFQIKDGQLIPEDQNFFDGPEFVAHCGSDKEHDIYPQPHDNMSREDFDDWIDTVEECFRKKVLEWL